MTNSTDKNINDISTLYIILFFFILFLMIWIILCGQKYNVSKQSIIDIMNNSEFYIKK